VARTAFYNNLDLATNLLGAALQLSITPWLLVRRGAGWGLVVPSLVNLVLLAAVALIGSGSVSFFGYSVPLLLAVMLVITRGFAYGMTKPAVDALYTRVPREMRYKGKNFVETAVWRFGDLVVTSAVSWLRMLGWGIGGLALAGAGVAALATLVSRRAGWSPDLEPEEKVRANADARAPL
jgi:AAA family ATP:ADP antiporter